MSWAHFAVPCIALALTLPPVQVMGVGEATTEGVYGYHSQVGGIQQCPEAWSTP